MAIIVCPNCRYGFQGDDDGNEQACPRSECQHRWEALTQPFRAVLGVERRRTMFELVVEIAGGSPRVGPVWGLLWLAAQWWATLSLVIKSQ